MDNREKVIKGLECCAVSKLHDRCNKCPYYSSCGTEYGSFAEIAHDALELLKSQEPIKRIMIHKTDRNGIVFEYACQNCYTYLMKSWIACPVCGRKVKW